MKALIQVVNNEPRVSAITIAENTDNNYGSVRDRILQYKDYMEKMGSIPTSVLKTAVGKQAKEVAMLNERQATFLMILLKNTPKVVEFKFWLTNKFIDMRTPIIKPTQYLRDLHGMSGGLKGSKHKLKIRIGTIGRKQQAIINVKDLYNDLEVKIIN